jgi:hypothetical protein
MDAFTTIYTAVIAKLQGDTVLLGLLGNPADPTAAIRRAQTPEKITTAAVTLRGSDGSGIPFSGSGFAQALGGSAISAKKNPTIEISVWVNSQSSTAPKTGQDADAIEQRVNFLLLQDAGNMIPGTFNWQGTTFPQSFEKDTWLWHNMTRYRFNYFNHQGGS